jgi:hypothetical protein
MALVVEDGTGLSTAESYVSVADAATYASNHGLTFAASPEAAAEQALRRATQWLDATYGSQFPGTRTNGRSQALQWPRTDATDVEGEEIASDEIPVEIINATIEAAIRELATPGTLTPDLKRGGSIKRVKAGSVEVEYGAGATAMTLFTKIDAVLSSLIEKRSPYSVRAVRA